MFCLMKTRTSTRDRNRTLSSRRSNSHRLQGKIFVQLATPCGRVFSGSASAVEFSPANGVLQMEPNVTTYFGLVQAAEVTVRIGKRFRFFAALNATASIEDHRFTVIAEVIRPTVAPVRNCANPDCKCGDLYASVNPSTAQTKHG